MHKFDGPVNQGSYIVKVRDGVDKTGVLSLIGSLTGGDTKVTHNWNPEFFNAFAGFLSCPCFFEMAGPNYAFLGNFGDDVIKALTSSLDVEYIAEDGVMSAFDVQ